MARTVILYITASLDGFIADTAGGVGWLTGADGEDYGYAELMTSVDTVLQGSHTYLQTSSLVNHDPYAGKTNYVFTSRPDLPVFGEPTFVTSDAIEFVRDLKSQPGGTIWLVGGGELASALFSADLVDEVDLFVQPVVLGEGIPLWRPPMRTHRLELLEARACPGELAELRYRVHPSQ